MDVADAARPASHGRAAFGALISVLSVGGCVWWGLQQEAPRFPESPGHLGLLVAALAVYVAITAARGWRWDRILRRAGVDHATPDAFGLTVVGYMGNTVMPARGGEVLRILLLAQRSSASRREVLGSIIPERLLDAATLVGLFAPLTAFGVADAPTGGAPAVIGVLVLALGVVALYTYHRLRVAGYFEEFAARVRPVAKASRLLLTPAGLGLAALTIAIWFAEGSVFLLVTQSVDVSISPLEATFCVVVASFFALVPAGPGYLGTFDAALLFALHALDVRGGTAIGVVLLYRFVIFVPITLAGAALVVTRYGGISAARARLSAAR
jgi:uncharacterized membrane protein YbhN (UPF0104 family)